MTGSEYFEFIGDFISGESALKESEPLVEKQMMKFEQAAGKMAEALITPITIIDYLDLECIGKKKSV